MEYFSTTQIAERCGVARQTVVNYTHSHNIKVVKFADSHYPNTFFYDEYEAEKLCKIIAESETVAEVHTRCDRQLQKEKELELKRLERIEALKKVHPLVKDTRCFDEYFWP
jgi:predicted site-specific integrase-resolvase